MFKKGYNFFLFLLSVLILISCNKSVNKRDLGPDEYFEFAKSKFDKGHYLEAVTEFTVITLRYSGDPVIDDAQYYLAESNFKQKDYLIAISEYQKLIHDYPQSPYRELAQFKIGLSYYNLSLRPELDQEYTKKGIRAFQDYVEEYPKHELKEKAEEYILKLRKKLAKKHLLAATTYRKMGEYEAAEIYYELLLEKFYDTQPAKEAQFWKGEVLYKQKKYPEALNAFTAYVEKYPDHNYNDKAKKRISKLSEIIQSSETSPPVPNEANRN